MSEQPAKTPDAAKVLRYPFDPVLFAAAVALVVLGIVMSYSASAVYAAQKYHDAAYFLERDLVYTVLGALGLWYGARTDFSAWRRWAYPMLVLAMALLFAVLLVGARMNGAARWFRLGPLSLQPAEPAKFALVVWLSYSLAKKAEKVRIFAIGFLPHLVVAGLMAALLLRQPDFGTAAILGLVTLLMLLVAGTKISYIVVAILGAAPLCWKVVTGTPWRLRRMLAFLDPWPHRHDVGYQITESLISVGSGGISGFGLGDGRQKLFFLPEAHTDFILAILGEELGLIGITLVVVLFGILVWRGLRAAYRAREPFGAYLAFGITALFGVQALTNMGVVLGSLPTKGLTLPLVSYGGSSLATTMFMAGVLLNVSRRAPVPKPDPLRRKRAPAARNKMVPGSGRVVVIEAAE
ncbi:MAG TPA: putative lipid II flippase FtsW [Polyangia bacterium]|nr:putative lipid II flippase FtsW [Polyangia bacterium]